MKFKLLLKTKLNIFINVVPVSTRGEFMGRGPMPVGTLGLKHWWGSSEGPRPVGTLGLKHWWGSSEGPRPVGTQGLKHW